MSRIVDVVSRMEYIHPVDVSERGHKRRLVLSFGRELRNLGQARVRALGMRRTAAMPTRSMKIRSDHIKGRRGTGMMLV